MNSTTNYTGPPYSPDKLFNWSKFPMMRAENERSEENDKRIGRRLPGQGKRNHWAQPFYQHFFCSADGQVTINSDSFFSWE
jgi:hypothetical protein